MPRALREADQAFNQALKQFVTLCERTARTLTRERDRLSRQLKAASARGKRLVVQAQTKAERLSKATTEQATDMLKKQIAELKELRAEAREEAKEIRAKLAGVRVDLASARQHLSRALHADKAMAAFEQQFEKAVKRITKRTSKKAA
jgi:uncharacterized phage infection (PIP) family protein YhgE